MGEEEELSRILKEMRITGEDDREVTMDDVYSRIGGFGPFQTRLTLVLSFTFGFVPAMSALMFPFIAPHSPEGACIAADDNITRLLTRDPSLCAPGTWHFINTHTITAEWNLIGADEWKVGFLNKGFFAGHAAGSIIFGWMSDVAGRYDTIIFTSVLTALLNLISICCFNYWSFFVVHAVYGTVNAALMVCSWVLMVENWGADQRSSIGSLAHIPAALGIITVAVLARLIPEWRVLVFTESCFQVLICVWFTTVLVESPRWLWSKQRTTEAIAILRRIAHDNKRQLPRSLPAPTQLAGGAQSMCSHTAMYRRFLVLLPFWFSIMLANFGLNFGNDQLTDDICTRSHARGCGDSSLSARQSSSDAGAATGRDQLLVTGMRLHDSIHSHQDLRTANDMPDVGQARRDWGSQRGSRVHR